MGAGVSPIHLLALETLSSYWVVSSSINIRTFALSSRFLLYLFGCCSRRPAHFDRKQREEGLKGCDPSGARRNCDLDILYKRRINFQ